MHDSRELSGVGRSIIGIPDSRKTEQQSYGGSSQLGETGFSYSSTAKMANSIAYGPNGNAFGVIPKEITDQLVDDSNDWTIKCAWIENINEILQDENSMKTMVSYAPSFLKFLCKVLNAEK